MNNDLPTPRYGRLIGVSLGPGDPDLITRRGWTALQSDARWTYPVKKAVVGNGNAEKAQVHAMVSRLLPGVAIAGPDAADALAVAITHAHHLASSRAFQNRSG